MFTVMLSFSEAMLDPPVGCAKTVALITSTAKGVQEEDTGSRQDESEEEQQEESDMREHREQIFA